MEQIEAKIEDLKHREADRETMRVSQQALTSHMEESLSPLIVSSQTDQNG